MWGGKILNGFSGVNYTTLGWALVATVHKSSCHAASCSSLFFQCILRISGRLTVTKKMKEQHTGANSSSVIKVGEVIFFSCNVYKKGAWAALWGSSIVDNLTVWDRPPWITTTCVWVCVCKCRSCSAVCEACIRCACFGVHARFCRSRASHKHAFGFLTRAGSTARQIIKMKHSISVVQQREQLKWEENGVSMTEGNGWVQW